MEEDVRREECPLHPLLLNVPLHLHSGRIFSLGGEGGTLSASTKHGIGGIHPQNEIWPHY